MFRNLQTPGVLVRLASVVSLVVFFSGCAAISSYDRFSNVQQDSGPKAAVQMKMRAAPPPRLPTVDLELTPEVRREIAELSKPYSRFVAAGLERLRPLEKQLREILADEGVPPEILYLALIESGFRVDARSRAGAVGLWQFMPATARRYGLVVSRHEDQRKDPILSTIAAARHLRDLYRQFDDWWLALAAYNAGAGAISKAMKRTGADDFWTLSRKNNKARLRRETLRYVPRFIAVVHLVQELEAQQNSSDKNSTGEDYERS
jgi:membrane-bound lytic murein transglycosylase D